jgi:hypothetical protein
MLYLVDGVQGMCSLGQLRDAIGRKTFELYLTLGSLLVVPRHLLPLA